MNHHVTIIGIAGGTGSGKTTVVKKIAEALPPDFVSIVPQGGENRRGIEILCRYIEGLVPKNLQNGEK